MGEFGFRHKKKLKVESVPSVFPQPALNTLDANSKEASKIRHRGAIAKRERRRVTFVFN